MNYQQPDGARQVVQAATDGHAQIDLRVTTTRTHLELLRAWKPMLKQLNCQRRYGGSSSSLNMMYLLIEGARPTRPGCWLSRWPTAKSFKQEVGLERGSFTRAKQVMRGTGLVADSKLGPAWVVLFNTIEDARSGEPDPQPGLFGAPSEAHDASRMAHCRPPVDAPSEAHRASRMAHDASRTAHRGSSAYIERACARASSSTNDCDDLNDGGAACLSDDDRMAALAIKLPDGCSTDRIIAALKALGMGGGRAAKLASKRLCSAGLVRDVLDRFHQYSSQVRNPGAYLGNMLQEAIKDAESQARRHRNDQAAAEAEEYARAVATIEKLSDHELQEAVQEYPTLAKMLDQRGAEDVRRDRVFRAEAARVVARYLREREAHASIEPSS